MEFIAPVINPRSGRSSRIWEIAGKIDVLIRERATGRVLVVEHKTSGEDISDGSTYWRRLRMDGQVSIYYDGADALGFKVTGCLYDVIGKPGLRPAGVPITDADGVKVVLDANGERVRTKDGKKWRETADTAAGYVLQKRDETPEEFRARLVEAVSAEPDAYFRRGDVVRLESELDEARWDVWRIAQQMHEAERDGYAPRNVDACHQYGNACAYLDLCSGLSNENDGERWKRSENAHPELSASANGAASPVSV